MDKDKKVIILIAGYVCRHKYEVNSLVSDSQFVIQNCIRLLRCLMDLFMKKNKLSGLETCIKWCKLIENRMNPYDIPLRQFCRENYQGYNARKTRYEKQEGFMPSDLCVRLEEKSVSIDDLLDATDQEINKYLDSGRKFAGEVRKYLRFLPLIEIETSVKPIAQTVLKVDATITPKWRWSPRWHSKQEIFWIIVDNDEETLHCESFVISQKDVEHANAVCI